MRLILLVGVKFFLLEIRILTVVYKKLIILNSKFFFL